MPFAYFARLSPSRQRIYLKSDAISEVPLPAHLAPAPAAGRIGCFLTADRRPEVQAECQALLDELTGALRVPRVRVRVLAVRPSDHAGELHGLYEPFDGKPARISVWMRTAQQKRVVAFRTFVRTLLHELCHHLDYELYQLPETFHTEGFYKRESHLLRQVLGS